MMLLAALVITPTASAVQGFNNAVVADKGLAELGTSRETGWNMPGECIKSVQRWVTAAGGSFPGGGGVIGGYTSAGAAEVALGAAVKGDVIQYTRNSGSYSTDNNDWSRVHTVVVVANHGNGRFHIVQSNSPAGSGLVTQVVDWTPTPASGWIARVWRFGTVQSTTPIGNFEIATQNGTGVRFRGWARDPDTSSPIAVHAYVTPNHGVATTADLQRSDVGAHAFDVTRGGIVGGTYNVCVYGINAPGTPGENTLLGCRTITTTQSPIGNFEVATQNGTGVRFRGWAIDPDTAAPIDVHAYVTPNHSAATTASIPRADVAAEHIASGDPHGFDVTRGGIVAGTYNVCAYGINAPGTPGENTLLGCRTITLTQSPIGVLDTVEQDGAGVRFRGWAIDPDTAAPIDVHAYVTPNHGMATTANLARGDIAAEFTASGGNHGYEVTRGGIVPGTYNVCAYGINVPGTAGQNALLGCRAITLT
jgi:hypothetical protein